MLIRNIFLLIPSYIVIEIEFNNDWLIGILERELYKSDASAKKERKLSAAIFP